MKKFSQLRRESTGGMNRLKSLDRERPTAPRVSVGRRSVSTPKTVSNVGQKSKTLGQTSSILKPKAAARPLDDSTQFKVDIDGLPPTFIQGKSTGEILARLRKIVKQTSMIKDVDRVTTHDVKKAYRDKAQGRED